MSTPVTQHSDTDAFNAAERTRAAEAIGPLRGGVSVNELGEEADDGSPYTFSPEAGEQDAQASDSDPNRGRKRQGGVSDGTLSDTVDRAVRGWRADSTFLRGDPLTDSESSVLASVVTMAVQHQLMRVRDIEMDGVKDALEEARMGLSFHESMMDQSRADVLRELQNAYNMISALVLRQGGEVTIGQDEVYEKDNSRLKMENTELGQIVLKRL